MKRKLVESLPPIETKGKGWIAAAQIVEDILVLDICLSGKLAARYCMNTENYEYEFLQKGIWYKKKIGWIFEDCGSNYYYTSYAVHQKLKFASLEDEKMVREVLGLSSYGNVVSGIDYKESEYLSNIRENSLLRRQKRVEKLHARVPALPENIKDWIFDRTGGKDYLFWEKERKLFRCTSCGKISAEKGIQNANTEKKVRHNEMVICPMCGKEVRIKKRTDRMEEHTRFAIMQPIDQEISVVRHFDVCMYWAKGEHKVWLSEAVRIVMNHVSPTQKYTCSIWYNQYTRGDNWESWEEKNPANRKTGEEYLYPENIRESLKNTYYEDWTRPFEAMAAAGFKVEYNRLMASGKRGLPQTIEYLFKGRFCKLVQETAAGISYWYGYEGFLHISEEASIEEVLGIRDRQLINRLRELDGGRNTLNWLRYCDESGKKISQETLNWLNENDISRLEMPAVVKERMSLQQIMNYVKRQQTEGYKGKSASNVLEQWDDYLSMCKRLKKKLDDEMIYRPRELKRRHDELVEEINRQNAIEVMNRDKERREAEAKKMREKFPGAEEVLAEVKNKYEYANEQYTILVPQSLVAIVTEGQVLHHCAGATDRYFDRIMQRETYICFLRKTNDVEVPFYTIEIEPSGTIRQHRSYYDEEPGIEEIRGFLKEWQQVIKKRLNEEDRRLAKISKIKREQNIAELKEKNNTRVLQGLMEDFMEAV